MQLELGNVADGLSVSKSKGIVVTSCWEWGVGVLYCVCGQVHQCVMKGWMDGCVDA